MLFRGKLPSRERELAVLRVAWLLGAPYAWGEHVKRAQRYGVASKEVERVSQGSAAAGWDEPQLIEFPMMVGQYVATALMQNALRVRLTKDNPGLTCR